MLARQEEIDSIAKERTKRVLDEDEMLFVTSSTVPKIKGLMGGGAGTTN